MAPANRSRSASEPLRIGSDGPATVLVVDPESTARERVREALQANDFAVRTAATVPSRLDDVDALVVGTGVDDGPGLLSTVRERDPALPVVLVTRTTTESVATAVRETPRTAHHVDDGSDAALALLADRVDRLVEWSRAERTAERALAALESAGDGIAIVAPDDAFAFVNRAYAREFGYDPSALVGRSWETVYDDDAVSRIRSTAIPTAAEGWRWMGTCVGRRDDGETFAARTGIVGLEDGGLVFVVSETDRPEWGE